MSELDETESKEYKEVAQIILYIVIAYYSLINVVGFIRMAVDKVRARENAWRIPELNLFGDALLGGFLGGLSAMICCWHKVKKCSFIVIYLVCIIAHCLFIYYAIYDHREAIITWIVHAHNYTRHWLSNANNNDTVSNTFNTSQNSSNDIRGQ